MLAPACILAPRALSLRGLCPAACPLHHALPLTTIVTIPWPSAQGFTLPRNVRATTDAAEAIAGAQYAVHAVPVQHSRAFLTGVREVLPKDVPIICVSKGLEVGSGCMMSEVIPSALGRRQPAVFLSGPSFAKEVRTSRGLQQAQRRQQQPCVFCQERAAEGERHPPTWGGDVECSLRRSGSTSCRQEARAALLVPAKQGHY